MARKGSHVVAGSAPSARHKRKNRATKLLANSRSKGMPRCRAPRGPLKSTNGSGYKSFKRIPMLLRSAVKL
eukprot:309932-Amphidinium_carterae.1